MTLPEAVRTFLPLAMLALAANSPGQDAKIASAGVALGPDEASRSWRNSEDLR